MRRTAAAASPAPFTSTHARVVSNLERGRPCSPRASAAFPTRPHRRRSPAFAPEEAEAEGRLRRRLQDGRRHHVRPHGEGKRARRRAGQCALTVAAFLDDGWGREATPGDPSQVPFTRRPTIVDVTDRARVVAAKIVETAVDCTDEERDVVLYYLVRS